MCCSVSNRIVARTTLAVALALVIGLTGGLARADYIVASDFNQTDGATIDTVAPNIANQPGAATWFQTGLVGTAYSWAFNHISGNVNEQGLSNGTGISIDSAGSYVKPAQMHVQADLRSGITTGTEMTYARGVALGFYDGTQIAGVTANPMQGFTGLVLANDGGLYVFQGGSGINGQGTASSKVAFGGTFSTSAYYTLGYNVNTATGAISNVTLSGSTADYSSLTSSAFSNAATANLGFLTSSEDGGAYGYVDNVSLSAVPEPASCAILTTGLIGLLAYAWRKRK
jgi:hypothetical protein